MKPKRRRARQYEVSCAAPCNGVDDDRDGQIDEVAMGTAYR